MKCNLISTWHSWKIADFILSNIHSLSVPWMWVIGTLIYCFISHLIWQCTKKMYNNNCLHCRRFWMGAGALPLFSDTRPFFYEFHRRPVHFGGFDRRLLLSSRSDRRSFFQRYRFAVIPLCLSKSPFAFGFWSEQLLTMMSTAERNKRKKEEEALKEAKKCRKLLDYLRCLNMLHVTHCTTKWNENVKKKKKIFTMFSHCSK